MILITIPVPAVMCRASTAVKDKFLLQDAGILRATYLTQPEWPSMRNKLQPLMPLELQADRHLQPNVIALPQTPAPPQVLWFMAHPFAIA